MKISEFKDKSKNLNAGLTKNIITMNKCSLSKVKRNIVNNMLTIKNINKEPFQGSISILIMSSNMPNPKLFLQP